MRTGAAKAVIRAAFEQVPPAVLDKLEQSGYERSEALLLSREITAEGKSSCASTGCRPRQPFCGSCAVV